ncbi:MAG: tetratricopeptide repeat protein [Planctomycetota bacterium]
MIRFIASAFCLVFFATVAAVGQADAPNELPLTPDSVVAKLTALEAEPDRLLEVLDEFRASKTPMTGVEPKILDIEIRATRRLPYLIDPSAECRAVIQRYIDSGLTLNATGLIHRAQLALDPDDAVQTAHEALTMATGVERVPAGLGYIQACRRAANAETNAERAVALNQDARRTVEKMLADFGDDVRVLEQALTVALGRDGSEKLYLPSAALDMAQRLARLAPDSVETAIALAGLLADAGRYDDAVRILDALALRQSLSVPLHYALTRISTAQLFDRNSRSTSESRDTARAAVVRRFQNRFDSMRRKADRIDALRDEAGLYVRLNETENAVRTMRRILDLSPGEHTIRAQYERLEGFKPFWGARRLDNADILAAVRAASKRYDGAADSVCVIRRAVIRVFEDGSSERIELTVRLALTRRGIPLIAEAQSDGESIALRTWLPDGDILDADAPADGSVVAMPGLVPGAAVESTRRLTEPSSDAGVIVHWALTDPSTAEPAAYAELVLILPTALDASVRLVSPDNSLSSRIDRREQINGDRRELRFILRDVNPLSAEPLMPDDALSPPTVVVSRSRDARAVLAEKLADTLRRSAFPSFRVRAAVRETLANAEREQGDRQLNDYDTALALFRLVQNKIVAFEPGLSAHETLAANCGSRATLLFALLSAAGLDPALVLPCSDPEAALTGMDAFLTSAESDAMIYIDAPDGAVWLDPACRWNPVGAIGQRGARRPFDDWTGALNFDDGFIAVRLDGKPLSIEPPAHPSGDVRDWKIMMTLIDDRTAVASGFLRAEGALGAALNERLAGLRHSERETILNALSAVTLPGFIVETADIDQTSLAALSDAFGVSFVCRNNQPFGLSATGCISLPLGIPPVNWVNRFAPTASRRFPVVIRADWNWTCRAEIRLVEPMRLLDLPAPVSISAGGITYNLDASLSNDRQRIEIVRRVRIEPGRVEPEDYASFRTALERIDSMERRSLTVRAHPQTLDENLK